MPMGILNVTSWPTTAFSRSCFLKSKQLSTPESPHYATSCLGLAVMPIHHSHVHPCTPVSQKFEFLYPHLGSLLQLFCFFLDLLEENYETRRRVSYTKSAEII